MVGYRSETLARPPADATGPVSADDRPTSEGWSERATAALPLFLVGAACLALGIEYYLSGAVTGFGGTGVRLQPWTLFLALGVTGLAAGIFTLFVEDEEPAEVVPEPVRTAPRSVAAVAAASPDLPEWDESAIEPEEPVHLPPRTWERLPSPAERQGTSGLSPDLVLDQIDQIEASLRRKTPPTAPP